MNTQESLQRFGTVAFAAEMIAENVTFDGPVNGRLDASRWFAIVPEAYRADVLAVAEEIFSAGFRGRLFEASTIEGTLSRFATSLSNALSRLERRPPVAPAVSGEWSLPMGAGSPITSA